ncbi:PREDICTED: integrin alpha-4 [Dipodomys ordii]|uniref:Integrin alpha-4 n=1 Tax=Dipodomys ordii TaxID=10020 RepID=A0A1S3G617_DIPOR|nr:PREDICTED: integrin alpha-4 [Dipodomys ordii]XP_012884266.1 PREDICTED: integrin alpha-4 [Dipodomys ordii]XP_012884272.1 PREDICTED: integrin alpha-4 [Dipodomys ordii]
MAAEARRGPGPRGAAVRQALMLLLCLGVPSGHPYNVDTESALLYQGPSDTLFGYSVVLHSHGANRWLVVGAPTANWLANASVVKPGAIYRCRIGENPGRTCEQLQLGSPNGEPCGKTCLEERDNQWLGVTLSRQPGENGSVVTCGHRWKNIFYIKNENKLPSGVCYGMPSNLRTELSKRMSPCYQDYVRKFGENFSSCQAGISSFYTEDLIVMGAPGSSYWTGSLFVYNITTNKYKAFVDRQNQVKFGSYLGYSVGAGHFRSQQSTEVVGGAPQHEQIGKAYIFSIEEKELNILYEMKGKKLGSYFGASVCAVDLNADGFSDLLVGAPMQSTIREEGRVFVYINTGTGAVMNEMETMLIGSDRYAARFGESIVNLGDIDNDGFPDVAVGAPQEDDLRGAIYIYNGREDGISSTFSQRIEGLQISKSLRMFGQSISGQIDADNNGYIDVAVGAFRSDSAVLLRTRPVVIVEASLSHPESVNRTTFDCIENGLPSVCMDLTLCFSYKGKEVPGYILLFYNMSLDVNRKAESPSRFYFSTNGTSDVMNGIIQVSNRGATCRTHQAFMRKDVRDILTPIQIEAAYHLGHHIISKRSAEEFPPLQPILQQKKEKDIIKKTINFARFCAHENCSANLQVSAKIGFMKPYENKTYLALGSMKTLMLNVSLFNGGDDAYETSLRVKLPAGLYFIKILDLEEKQINCEVTGNSGTVKLDCSVGYIYVDHLSRTDISFLLDVSSLHKAEEDLNITVHTSCENEELDDLKDNTVTLAIPLRYEVMLSVHGFVNPTSFVYGSNEDNEPETCMAEKMNFTFHVINTGISMAPNVSVEIMVPNSFAPQTDKLFNILDVQTTAGQCSFNNYERECTSKQEKGTMEALRNIFKFLSKTDKRLLYCMNTDLYCLNFLCNLGRMESGKEASVHIQLEGRSSILEMDDTSALKFEIRATAFPEPHPKVIELNKDENIAYVTLEGLHHQRPNRYFTIAVISSSLLLGLLVLLLISYVMWKAGFFKRQYKSILQEEHRRDSWSYVNSKNNEDD